MWVLATLVALVGRVEAAGDGEPVCEAGELCGKAEVQARGGVVTQVNVMEAPDNDKCGFMGVCWIPTRGMKEQRVRGLQPDVVDGWGHAKLCCDSSGRTVFWVGLAVALLGIGLVLILLFFLCRRRKYLAKRSSTADILPQPRRIAHSWPLPSHTDFPTIKNRPSPRLSSPKSTPPPQAQQPQAATH